MGDFYRFLESALFSNAFYGCIWFLLILSAFNIFSICLRGIGTLRLSKKADLSDGAKSFVPYARNVLLCRIAEKCFEKKYGKPCAEYSKNCSLLQTGNICADVCAAGLTALAFLLYGKDDYTISTSVIVMLIGACVCLVFRLVFGILNRVVISKSLDVIREAEKGKSNGFLKIACLIAPIADISAFVLAQKKQ